MPQTSKQNFLKNIPHPNILPRNTGTPGAESPAYALFRHWETEIAAFLTSIGRAEKRLQP